MPELPSFKVQIYNPDSENLSGFPFPMKLPHTLWTYMRGSDPWDPDEVDNMNLGDGGYIIKWPELGDFWALAKLNIPNPSESEVFWIDGAGCTPEDVFDVWLELENENPNGIMAGSLEDGKAVISESTSTTGNHVIIITNTSNGQAFMVNRNYYTGKTEFTYFGLTTPSLVSDTIPEKIRFRVQDGYFDVMPYEDGEWQEFISGLPLQQAIVLVAGESVSGRVYSAPKPLPEGVTYDWYDYDTQEHYEWATGEAPWDTSNPSIDEIEAPEKATSGEAFRVEVATTDVESLEFVFGGVSYPGANEGEGVFSAEIEAPPVTEKTSLVLYAQYGDLIEETSILIYPALPVPTRVKFLQNGSETSILTMETGQKAFVDVLVESNDSESWSEVYGSVSAIVVSYDGESFEEMAMCKVEDDKILVEADLPVGVYYLQVTTAFDSPVPSERVQRLKLNVVVDRRR